MFSVDISCSDVVFWSFKKINFGDEERSRGAGATTEEAEGRGDRCGHERNIPDQVIVMLCSTEQTRPHWW